MIIKRAIIISCLILLICGCSRMSYIEKQTGKEKLKRPHIRVKILETDKIKIECEGTYRLNCISIDSSAKGYYSVAPLNILAAPSGIKLTESAGFTLDTGLVTLYISPRKRNSHLIINGHPFRGVLEIHAGDKIATVINVLNIEEYLKGVLPPEIGRLNKKGYEALKAQSVAARTYAYSCIKANSENRFDLVNSIMDQVYIGVEGEYELANKAIDDTRGKILTFNGNPIVANYHSTCGGYTEDVSNAWDKHENGYLLSVDDSSYCEWSKFHDWEMSWHPDELTGYLMTYLKNRREYEGELFTIEDIKILERFPTGRISHLAVETNKGEFLFFKDQIRWAFRRPGKPGQILPSSNFDIRLWRDHEGRLTEISAEGHGYGHGVGMCQTGAIGRARAGQKYDYILKTYYFSVEIERVY
jgi:stage II sporulation protein D (peptidoglycan lytic transglycosylase)